MLFASLPSAAGVGGKWSFHVVPDAGIRDPEFVLQQKGGTLTGTYTRALGRVEVRGTVNGDDIEILFDSQNEMIRCIGKLEESDKISGTVKYAPLVAEPFRPKGANSVWYAWKS